MLASYSITDERRQVVGQAGPYMVTGQQLLVPEDSDVEATDDLQGKEVCSVTGSTSLDNVKAEGMKPVGFDTYSQCVEKVLDGTVEAMSTDGTILAGYAAQNEGELKVVGEPFSEERIGVGYSKDYPGDVPVDHRHARAGLRGRRVGRGLRGHARRLGRRDARAPRDGLLRVPDLTHQLIGPDPAGVRVRTARPAGPDHRITPDEEERP